MSVGLSRYDAVPAMMIEREIRQIERRLGLRLTPFQRRAVSLIVSTRKSVLVVAPTGAGKSVIGYAALLHHRRGFYIAPLTAIMYEKYRELRGIGLRVAVSNRDYKIPVHRFLAYDVKILSPYKFLTIVDEVDPRRHGDVIVVDEIHKVSNDPLFEAAITHALLKGFRIVALSATVSPRDAELLAKWLGAEVVASDERPVPLVHVPVKLYYGVSNAQVTVEDCPIVEDGEVFDSKATAAAVIAARLWSKNKKPVIVWAPRRRMVEQIAYKAASYLKETPDYIKAASTLPRGNDSERLLAVTARRGVFFHHGGLSYAARSAVYNIYRKLGGVMVTAYTLSHGVNMPGRYLVIATLRDWRNKILDASTFHQIAGRAGRPGYDDKGYVLTIIWTPEEMAAYERITRVGASEIEPSLLSDPVDSVRATLPAMRHGVEHAESFLRRSLSFVKHGDEYMVKQVLANAKTVEEFYRTVPDREGDAAMEIGILPVEYKAMTSILSGLGYQDAVIEILNAFFDIEEKRGRLIAANHWSTVSNEVLTYGYLATILAESPVSREAANYVQHMLETAVYFAAKVYGWNSKEREHASHLARMFAYAGNPRMAPLANRLRIDTLRRVIRAAPQFVTGVSDYDEATTAAYAAIKEMFAYRRRVPRREAEEKLRLVWYALTGDEEPPRDLVEKIIAEVLRGVGE